MASAIGALISSPIVGSNDLGPFVLQTELEVLGVIAAYLIGMWVVYTGITLVVGALTLLVRRSYVTAIETRIRNRPVRSGALGFGLLIGALVAVVVAAFAVPVGMQLAGGVEAAEIAIMVVTIIVFLGVFIAATVLQLVAEAIGAIAIGTVLVTRFRGASGDGERPHWLGLLVGAIVINIPVLVFVLGPIAVFLGLGAMVGHWRSTRGGGARGTDDVTAAA